VSLRVRVKPRSSKDEIGDVREGALVVRLKAPPVEGAANDSLVRLLGRALRVPPSEVRITRGERGRGKTVTVRGLTADVLRARLAAVTAAEAR
jgi:uncharacterized protein (TIGR00251 family)